MIYGGSCNANAGNYAFAAMRGKTYDSCSTSAGSYATAVMRGKTCGVSNTQAREIMQLLPWAGKPLAAALQAW